MNLKGFNTYTLANHPQGDVVKRVLLAALRAVDPAIAVAQHLTREGDLLIVNGRTYDLRLFKRVWLVAAGKAGAPMAHAAARILGGFLSGGVVIVKNYQDGDENSSEPIPARVILYEAGHPVPDQRGVDATQQISQLLKSAGAQDMVICLISGGGSALLTSPFEGITLEDMRSLTKQLLASGASIDEINTLRKHLDSVKGGGLARLAAPAQVLTLILSDVVGDPLDVIASGPTVPDSSTFADALAILRRYGLVEKSPAAIVAHLEKGAQGDLPETPKPGDPLFTNITHLIVGSNILAAEAAIAEAKVRGFNTMLLTTFLQGEARQAGRMIAAIARQIAANQLPVTRPACIVVGGETTVTLQGDGLGGRNLELALGAVRDMAGLQDVMLISLATDGDDGPTGAAGAVVNGETLARAKALDLSAEDYLARNDSYHFFEPLDDLLVPGQTQTNVNDLAFLFAF
jgi:glycerate 2-kinase